MKPVLDAWPPKKRTAAFGPMAFGIWLVTFIVIALATQKFLLAILIPPILGIAGAWALVGWPDVGRKDGKPWIEPRYKPYLFFVLAPFFAIILYPLIGVLSTETGLPPAQWMTLLIIALSIIGGIAGAYFLVGVPNVVASAKRNYQQLPPERRPFLFFPLALLFFLIFVLILGVVSTRFMSAMSGGGDPTALLNIQLLVVIPISLALAALVAWLMVGIPKPTKSPGEYLPKVTGKHRLRIFIITSLLASLILTFIIGAVLTYTTALPGTATLGLALALGVVTGIAIAILMWGTPARWRTFEDYQPGINPRARAPLIIGVSIFAAIATAVAIGLANIDLFWGALVGLFVGALVALFLTGTHRRIASRRGQSTLVPDMPDALKALLLLGTWAIITIIVFAVLTYALPGLVGVNLLVALVGGLAIAFFLLEQPLLKEMRAERARERQKRKDWEARRKARLEEANAGPGPGPGPGPGN